MQFALDSIICLYEFELNKIEKNFFRRKSKRKKKHQIEITKKKNQKIKYH